MSITEPYPIGVAVRAARRNAARKEQLAALVARAIEDHIVASGWPVGAVVGSEATLMERYGVSRAVLRGAIRIVEHHQVAIMRRGQSGGLAVRAPDATAAANAAVVYLESVGSTVSDLLQARLLLEPMAVAAAAERITEEGIVALRALSEQRVDEVDPQTLGACHTKLAELSGNPVLQLFIEVAASLTEHYTDLRPTSMRERARTVEDVGRIHHAIIDAVIAGDTAKAQHHMVTHLEAMSQWLTTTAHPNASNRAPSTPRNPGPKLAEVVAEEIRGDILHGRRRTGDVVGSQEELLARYGVSRATLREAVRLLEHHSVAQMRRGPGGGLIVADPAPDAGIEAMALCLDFRGATAGHLAQVRAALELGCIENVLAKADDPAVNERLRETLVITPDTPEDKISAGANRLHLTLAELSGNPVLAYFLRTLMNLWLRHEGGDPDQYPVPVETAAGAVAQAHSAIVEAILAGDRALARHRMTRHLNALTPWWQ